MEKKIGGGNIAGGNPARGRVSKDFYATPEIATEKLLEVEHFEGLILEPACGMGHISKILEKKYSVKSFDIENRGYGDKQDFLLYNEFADNVVTNPPFSLFQEFAEHSLEITNSKVCLFGKLQALEGQKRSVFLETSPLKTVYVFRKRINPMRDGKETDEKGKRWASTMAFAWYVWEKGYEGKPTIEWI
ncbi:MAG: class I SAM-dependent methyltransferase [Candidatus Dojkabacteria bacterium]|jgi:hypothetical protein|nr:class I SAM-dependent methyltransferase [Candidatus Dojkabacteria bacterium]